MVSLVARDEFLFCSTTLLQMFFDGPRAPLPLAEHKQFGCIPKAYNAAALRAAACQGLAGCTMRSVSITNAPAKHVSKDYRISSWAVQSKFALILLARHA